LERMKPQAFQALTSRNFLWEKPASYAPPPPDLGELGPLLRRLLDALEELTASVSVGTRSDAKAWRRIAIADLEIQVREPADLDESARLGRHAAALRELLKQYPIGDD
jgi:hypothetical protein